MCLSPIRIKNVRMQRNLRTPFLEDYIEVPCGKCVECLKAKISERLCSLYMEFIDRKCYACFVTLTLSDEVFLKDMSGVMRSHVNPMLSELRKNPEIKYFLTSEYGSTTDRPHYHMIVFGFQNLKQCETWFLENWTLGQISVSDVNDSRFTYVASCHITKCSHIPEYCDFETGELKQCNKPFTISSRGIGFAFAKRNYKRLYSDGVFMYKGKPFHLPIGIKTMLARMHYKTKDVTSTFFRLKERCAQSYNDHGVFDRFEKYLPTTIEDEVKRSFSPSEFAECVSDALFHQEQKFKTNYVNKSLTRQKL